MKNYAQKIDTKFVKKEDIAPLFSALANDCHKGNLGQLIVVGGSKCYVGAPLLAEMGAAAMRVGAGLNVLAVPSFLMNPLRERILTSSLFELSDNGDSVIFKLSEFRKLKTKATAFAVGMGFGNGEADKIIEFVLKETKCNFVLDADGLICVCKTVTNFENRAVLTPHLGEFAKITGKTVDEIKTNAQELAVKFAKDRKCVLVLKSHQSIITGGESVFINTTGNAKLAKGGSGDVLAGIIGGLLARGVSPLDAAKAGSYILGKCADLSTINEYSHLSCDTVAIIPKVLDYIQSKNE